MASLLLAYGHSADQDGRWMRFTQQLGRWGQPKLTIDNRPNTLLAEVQGSNLHYEFSGYLEGLDALIEKYGTQARIFVFNDSLFSHHSARRWAEFLKDYVPRRGPGVYGDPRLEPVHVDGKPLHHLASWMFLLEGSNGQQAFREALQHALQHFDESPEWPGYSEFLAHYYAPSRRWGGYTQALSPQDLERKMRCSWAEHRLSLHLQQQGMMYSFTGLRYQGVHAVDRALSAIKRLKTK
ncbi:MAG: hypothetical protein NWR91_00425 [Schleiferiaceae bacterium]|jgi:hypothetical protein|nr:hypothetical protein [Schleiferiaceae bacterium]